MKKFVSNLLMVVLCAVAVYFIACVVDVNRHNDPFSEGYRDYCKWNMWTVSTD